MTQSKRLEIRHYTKDDLVPFHRLSSDPAVWYFTDQSASDDLQASYHALLKRIEDSSNAPGKFAITRLEDNTYIGECGVDDYSEDLHRMTISSHLLPRFWHRGYATEVTQLLVNHLFETYPVERIDALVSEDHTTGRIVLEKCGFTLEGTLRRYLLIDDVFKNVCCYSLLRDERE